MAFGDFITTSESLGLSTTTSGTFIQKLRLTTPAVDAGDYRISWSYTWGHSTQSDDFEAQIDQDDTTVLYTQQSEPQDSGADQEYPAGGFAQVTLTAAVHTFDLDFRTSNSGDTARISQARFEFWKVD